MNKLIILSLMLGTLGGANLMSDISNVSSLQITELNKNKILDINFDTNEIKNTVDNKTYSSAKGTGTLVNSDKGKGFQTNSDYIVIPSEDLNIPTTEEYVTVTAQYKYGGTDTEQMIYAFGLYDLWFYNGSIGFNTGYADMYGVPFDAPTNEFVTLTAVFHKTDITKCKLYINGIKQELSFRNSNTPVMKENPFSQPFYIACWGNPNGVALPDGANVIDEVKIFKGDITDEQAEKLAMVHRIPELSVRQEGLYAQANWATEILESDTIYSYSFEEGEFIPRLTWNQNILGDNTGGQKITTEEAYSGAQSIYTPKTIGGLGNHYGFPSTQSNTNIIMFNRHYFDNGTKLSVSFRIKDVSGNNIISAHGDGGWGNTLTKLTPIIVEDSPAGSKTIKVNSLSGVYIGLYITSDRNVNYVAESCRQIRDIQDNGDGTYTLTVNAGFAYEQKAGDNLYTRPWRGAWSFGSKTHNSSEWQLYNLNTSVSNYSDYDVSIRGGSFYINTTNQGLSYLDDLKFGYATKVKLYRDDNLIYEGYESQYNDKSAIDKKSPIMNEVKVDSLYEGDNRKITMSFDKVVDDGTLYNYSIKSIGNSGKETFLSENKSITIISGLKGYSYVIDKNANTVPGNTINLNADATSINYSIPKSETGAYYLHIKPIDNQGNVGETKHILIDNPTLTAKANPSEDMIRLDWSMNDTSNKIFKVYQKKEGTTVFQSISSTNFNKVKQMKVLNVYPTSTSAVFGLTNITFTTWDGETVTLPSSANLKQWMEEPNEENPKGYGKGIIEVIPVSIDEFNANPSKYLKDSNGEYLVEAIMFGTWDSNCDRDISVNAYNETVEFLDSGRGVLLGHDTMRGWIPNFSKLKDRLNLTLGTGNTGPNYSGSIVTITKKGLLTNYPWEIGDIGTNLTIPYTHTVTQTANGDIWMQFGSTQTNNNSNFYLTSWNNIAFIQTGHSSGQATPDEQKVIANTLFYLNQLSSENFLDDYSGQDVKAPNKPVISSHKFTEDGFIELNFNSVIDNGSTYEYYVESNDKNGNSLTLSNVVSDTITSGLKGYSFVVDNKSNTIPDNTIEQSNNETIKIKTNNNDELYVHIKAIDNVGNTSETYHYKITDMTKPTLKITLNPSSWTNNSVRIDVTATDSDSGVKQITLPNGTVIKGTTGSYTVDKNGIYYFKALDYMGNEIISAVMVTNIDKNKPTVIINNNQNWINKDVSVTITATDK